MYRGVEFPRASRGCTVVNSLWCAQLRQVLWQSANVMITAVAFSMDAKLVVAGLYDGRCIFYGTDGLRYHTQVRAAARLVRHDSQGCFSLSPSPRGQIECRNRKGPLRKGKKVAACSHGIAVEGGVRGTVA